MNGPWHYREAEKLLGFAQHEPRGTTAEQSLLAEAQVHATLAVAAAIGGLDAHEGPNGGAATGRSSEDATAWAEINRKDES